MKHFSITFYFLLTIFIFIQTSCKKEYYEKDDYFNDFRNDFQGGDKFEEYGENPFVKTTDQPYSTFSVDADGASYTIMRSSLNSGSNPPKSSVRVEEYLNYFTFDYAEPSVENVSLESEIATCPWNTEHHLIRLGIKGKTIPTHEMPNSNYVFLIDVSGSMSGSDRIELLKQGFKKLTDHLRDNDRVAIITYAGKSGVHLESTKGNEKKKIKSSIDNLKIGGSTAGEAGIKKAYEIAQKHFIQNGNNRVILGTDGDFNVGMSSSQELIGLIKEKRKSGIYLTVVGVGRGNLNDHMMEQLANKGNGTYEYIDNLNQIEKVFIHEKGKFFSVATDSKIQITFNPNMVETYRLIGYENRSLTKEEFDNDTTDAGEIGSGQTITALYEVQLKGNPNIENYLQFDFKYKMPNQSNSRLVSHYINMAPKNIDAASENMRFAASVVGFGMLMKQSEYKKNLSKQILLDLCKESMTFDPHGYRKEFFMLVNKSKE